MRGWTRPPLVQVMACPLFVTKPSPVPFVAYCMTNQSIGNNFGESLILERKCIYDLQNLGLSVPSPSWREDQRFNLKLHPNSPTVTFRSLINLSRRMYHVAAGKSIGHGSGLTHWTPGDTCIWHEIIFLVYVDIIHFVRCDPSYCWCRPFNVQWIQTIRMTHDVVAL